MPSAPPPLAFLRDPLLERDYVRLCSRPSNFRNRAVGVGLVGIVLVLVLFAQRRETALDTVGWTLHLVFTWGAAFLVSMQALTEAATAVPTERATGTLTVLLTVPRRHARLAAGFLLSRLALSLTGFLALLPLEGIALLLGGVSGEDLLLALLTIFTAALFSVSVGLFAGHAAVGHRRAVGRATFLSMGLTIILPFLLLCVAGLISLEQTRPTPAAQWFLDAAGAVFLANPLSPLVYISMKRLPFPGFGIAAPTIFGLPLGIAVLYAVASVFGTGRGLRLEDERAAVGSGPGLLSLFRRKGGRKAAAAVAPRPAGAGVWSRPLWWMEARPLRNPWARWGLRAVFAGYTALVLWLMLHPRARANLANPERFNAYDFLLALPLWAIALSVMTASGTLVAEERERSSLDLLRAAPLSPGEIALARPLGILWKARPLIAAVLVLAAAAVLFRYIHPLGPPAWVLGILLVLPFYAMASFRIGMGASTVRQAGRRMGLLAAAVILGWPLLIGFVAVVADQVLGDRIAEYSYFLFALDPVVAMLGPMFLQIDLLDSHRGEETWFACAATAMAFLYLLLGLRLWRGLPRALDRALHREDG